MALRDTIRSVAENTRASEDFETRKPALIAAWQDSVRNLNVQISQWLAEYESDGSVRFEREEIEIREEMLGLYSTEAMNIHIGPFVVRIQPVGRIIIGAVGRIDMYRQGRSSRDERVLFLRSENAEEGESWKLRQPLARGGKTVDLETLNAASFETALDGLLH